MNSKFLSEPPNRTLDHNSPIPLHYQLTEILRHEITNGNLVGENGKVPTEAEIAKRFQISRITVRSAFKTLVDEGLLRRERGRGTFLKTNQVENWAGQLMGFAETIQAAGFAPRGKVLHKGSVRPLPERVRADLDLAEAWELKRLRFADDEPIAIEHSYFTPEIGRELERQTDLDNILTYRFIERELNIGLREAKQLISAVNATQEEADMLEIEDRDALLYIERVTRTRDGRPIEYLKAIYRPDYFHYVIQLTRQG